MTRGFFRLTACSLLPSQQNPVLALKFNQAGHISRGDQLGLFLTVLDRVRPDLDGDDLSVLQNMPPDTGVAEAIRSPRYPIKQIRNIFDRPYVLDRHVKELLLRVTVSSYGRIVHAQKHQCFRIVDPHRFGVRLEKFKIKGGHFGWCLGVPGFRRRARVDPRECRTDSACSLRNWNTRMRQNHLWRQRTAHRRELPTETYGAHWVSERERSGLPARESSWSPKGVRTACTSRRRKCR